MPPQLSAARWIAERRHDVAVGASFSGAFVTNSHGMAALARIDEVSLPTEAGLLNTAVKLLAAAPYDPI